MLLLGASTGGREGSLPDCISSDDARKWNTLFVPLDALTMASSSNFSPEALYRLYLKLSVTSFLLFVAGVTVTANPNCLHASCVKCPYVRPGTILYVARLPSYATTTFSIFAGS
jgi:hypothetical protein